MRLDTLQIIGQRGDASRQGKGACPLERVTLAVRPVPSKMGYRVHVERSVEELLGILAFRERLKDASCGGASFVFGHARSFMMPVSIVIIWVTRNDVMIEAPSGV